MSSAAPCAHCGLALAQGPDPRVAGSGLAFCCGGCETVYALLADAGLASYHAFRERRQGPAVASGKSYAEFDHPTFARLHVRARADGLHETDLQLEGVQCASCVWLLERAPRIVAGLVAAEVDLGRGRIVLTWDPARVALSRIAAALDRLGYRPHPFRGLARDALRRDEERRMLLGLGIAGALAGNVMTIALATYAGWFGHMDVATERYFRLASLALTLPSVFGPGRVFFHSAWAALRTRTLHMDVPIALAIFAGVARGTSNVLSGHGPVYFDGVALLVFLLLVGRFLQLKAQRAALDATELGTALTPRTAWLVAPAQGAAPDGGVNAVPAEALLPGSVVEVRSGETLPADGVVVRGTSALDLSLLTGESRPVRAAVGDVVFAGTVNRGALLRVRVERAGEETRVARLVHEVEAGARKRAPVVQLADRIAGRFVLVVLALAAVTWLVWRNVDPAAAIDRAIALLIVTCPCALALATPLAVTVALGRAARAGILIKSGAALERLARPARLLLDKTGTLTAGRLALVEYAGDPSVRQAVVALERHARHPVADALLDAWGDVPAAVVERAVVTPGGGVEGRVDGHAWAVGSPAFVRARTRGAGGEPSAHGGDGRDLTPVDVARDGVVVGRAWFDDPVRDDAAPALAALTARGFRPSILSGDALAVVRRVARGLGLPAGAAEGEVSPEAKVRVVERELLAGPVVMVGDGVNDAAAMARASVGVAVKGGAEASLEAADVYLARPGLLPLVELTEGAARTLAVIRRNVAFSLAYNLVGAALAMTGVINPLWAAVLMPLSSLTVVLASWTARTFDPPATVPAGAAEASIPVSVRATPPARESAA